MEDRISQLQPVARFEPHSFPADRNPALRYLGRLSAGSRRTQQVALDRIAALMSDGTATAGEMPWHLLDAEQTTAIRAMVARRYAPATTNRMLAALRGVLKEAWRLALMDAESYHHATALKNVAWAHPPRGRTLSDREIGALFQACTLDPSPAGVRDAALLTVLYAGGLRRAEVVALDVSDYDASSGALTVRSTRDTRERVVFARDGAAEVLDRWLALRGPAPGPLFVPINKGSKVLVGARRMNAQSIYQVLIKRAEQAGVAAVSSQDLRRTFITRLLESGADLSTVQRLAGHASATTTQRYDRRSSADQRERARMLDIPSVTR